MVASTVFLDIEQEHLGQRYDLMTIIDAIPWNKDGLITAIAQDIRSKDVLMLAWINREALLETLNTEQVCYWSRSRQCLWRKGESSGHHQNSLRLGLTATVTASSFGRTNWSRVPHLPPKLLLSRFRYTTRHHFNAAHHLAL